MLDLNHILLFIAIVSPLVLLVRLLQLRGERPLGWIAASCTVLLAVGVSWLALPSYAGYIGATFWALLLLLPSLAERRITQLLLEKRYRAARQLARVRRMLHPWADDSPHLPALLQALELARSGNLPGALDQLAQQGSEKSAAGRRAIAYSYALRGNWRGLFTWCRDDLTVTKDPAVRMLYLRALGETGALEDLAWRFAAYETTLSSSLGDSPQFAQELILLFAFSGEAAAVARLCRGPLASLPEADQQFWIATAELHAGKTDEAVRRLQPLRQHQRDNTLERAVEQRLAQAASLPPARLAPATGQMLARLRQRLPGPRLPRRQGATPAVVAFILLNLAMFVTENLLGGSTNPRTLHFLGALEPAAVLVRHEYWRLLTALFLHYGVLHILINLYALYLLGPALERMIGSWKFAAGYLLSGLGSSAGVVLLSLLRLTRADQLVGASGCVMGVIGISAGLILRHRQSPLIGRRLRDILVIVGLQTAFDLWTPQVSVAAHLSGFVSGVLIGLLFALF